MKANSEDAPLYVVKSNVGEDAIIEQAMQILFSRIQQKGISLESPQDTRNYLMLRCRGLEHEIFGCLYLDQRHNVICNSELFRGTIGGVSVHPREVVKEALKVNAAAVIFYHNHPSGNPEPSQADHALTRRLKEALLLVDIRVLDHIVVGDGVIVSLAERGQI